MSFVSGTYNVFTMSVAGQNSIFHMSRLLAPPEMGDVECWRHY
jgi:hypothetical protein